MANRNYAEVHPDNEYGQKGKMGMKNDDGRLKGKEYNKSAKTGKVAFKDTVDPNASAVYHGHVKGAE